MSDQTPIPPEDEQPLPDPEQTNPEAAAEALGGESAGLQPTPEPQEAADVEGGESADEPIVEADVVYAEASDEEGPFEEDEGDDTPAIERVKPAIPGMDLEVDIVGEGEDPLGRDAPQYDEDGELIVTSDEDDDFVDEGPIAAEIVLAADARYRATGKRKSAVGRVLLRPGTGVYTVNGKPMEDFFPRATLQRTIRQPLETVGYDDRMDVVARMHGGGVSAQAGALRHGISRALLEADPNLRGELKRRGFLTRDPRVKERKKAGLKKARKRPQFSKR
jgi:small subunit ribosomal protein S9